MKLTPKNWNEFQHYKDRAPSWIKLHKKLLDDYDFSRLPLASQALAPRLWLLASEYNDGVMDAEIDEFCFRLRLTRKDFLDALQPLLDKAFFIVASDVLAEREQDASLEKRTSNKKEEKNLVDLEFEKFKRAYPKRTGSQGWPEAQRFFDKAVKAGAIATDLISAAQKFCDSLPKDTVGTKYVPMAEKWMRRELWREFIPTEDEKRRAEDIEKFLESRGYGLKNEEGTTA